MHNRYEAQRCLKQAGYEPSSVYISKFKRLGGLLVSPHIHFDDHTPQEEARSTYLVVTVESIVKLLERSDSGVKIHRLRLDQ